MRASLFRTVRLSPTQASRRFGNAKRSVFLALLLRCRPRHGLRLGGQYRIRKERSDGIASKRPSVLCERHYFDLSVYYLLKQAAASVMQKGARFLRSFCVAVQGMACGLVGNIGFEPMTFSTSRRHSPSELIAHII